MRCPSCTSAGLLCAFPVACSCIFCHSCRRCSMRSSAAASLQGTTCPEQRDHHSAHIICGCSAHLLQPLLRTVLKSSIQGTTVHTPLHPRHHCWHVGDDGAHVSFQA